MIQFKQFPLNGLETFEDEMLFLLAGTIKLIAGVGNKSKLNGDTVVHCLIAYEKSPADEVRPQRLVKICKKYNKSFSKLFELRLISDDRGRYKLNIKENMTELSDDTAKLMDKVNG